MKSKYTENKLKKMNVVIWQKLVKGKNIEIYVNTMRNYGNV